MDHGSSDTIVRQANRHEDGRSGLERVRTQVHQGSAGPGLRWARTQVGQESGGSRLR